jgi:GNAT superfamily N-acetyltransferase
VWNERLAQPRPGARTILAEDDGGLVGFAHVIADHDPTWGALLDNIHVAYANKRAGVGAQLFAHVFAVAASGHGEGGLYLWVLEQNTAAQAFYEALGGSPGDRAVVDPPGGVPSRLAGSPYKLRYTWDTDALRPRATEMAG